MVSPASAQQPARVRLRLATYDTGDEFFRARGDEVNPLRPPFTGDVYDQVTIPGIEGPSTVAMILEHPCSMRRHEGTLKPHILVAAVREHQPLGAKAWVTGHFAKMPLPNLTGDKILHVADFDLIGRMPTNELTVGTRIACLSDYGVKFFSSASFGI